MWLIMVVTFSLIIGAMIALAIIFERNKKPSPIEAEDQKDDLKTIHVLLKSYAGVSRKHMALAFVKSGIPFMKGPFRNLMNFTEDQLAALPTNEELDAAKIDLHIAELEAEIERLKGKRHHSTS